MQLEKAGMSFCMRMCVCNKVAASKGPHEWQTRYWAMNGVAAEALDNCAKQSFTYYNRFTEVTELISSYLYIFVLLLIPFIRKITVLPVGCIQARLLGGSMTWRCA